MITTDFPELTDLEEILAVWSDVSQRAHDVMSSDLLDIGSAAKKK